MPVYEKQGNGLLVSKARCLRGRGNFWCDGDGDSRGGWLPPFFDQYHRTREKYFENSQGT
jgi:hypothetical protein